MRRLREQFNEYIDFVNLDWDDSSLDGFRDQYGITQRTQYVLVSPEDEILQRWFGFLNEETVAEYLQNYLDEQG